MSKEIKIEEKELILETYKFSEIKKCFIHKSTIIKNYTTEKGDTFPIIYKNVDIGLYAFETNYGKNILISYYDKEPTSLEIAHIDIDKIIFSNSDESDAIWNKMENEHIEVLCNSENPIIKLSDIYSGKTKLLSDPNISSFKI